MKNHSTSLFVAVVLLMVAGCGDTSPTTAEKPADEEPKPKAHLQTTDNIEEFKPEEGREIVDSKVQISNPITGALEAYEPIKQRIAEDIQIQHAVGIFQAMEGRYPRDYEEFMEKVIKANKIRLPALSPGKQYQYDVENHKLVVVRKESTE